MLNSLRRRLVVLTIVAAVFLLLTLHLAYSKTGLPVPDGMPSFINKLLPNTHTTDASQDSSRTSVVNDVNVQPTVGLSEPARTSESSSQGSAIPQPVAPTKTLVVARTKAENTDWIQHRLPDWQTSIYTVDDENAPLHARNKGHEASVYLTYIVDNYDILPDVMVFIHSHQKHKHGTRAERIFEGIDYDNFESIRALRLDFVHQNGFVNLRCLNNPGCPSEIQPFRPEAERDPLRPQEGAMAAAWNELFQNNDVPKILAAPCCAQFAVSRTQTQQRSKAEYERFRSWLYSTPLDDATSGRVFEYLWHVIFGKDPVYCPEEEKCYMDQYGSSSALVHQFQQKAEGNSTP